MNSETGSKINRLFTSWPPGTVGTLVWFKDFDIYQQLARAYEKSGWIKRIGQGAYIRNKDDVSWDGALYALQTQLKLPIHVSGISSLELQGRAQYLPVNEKPVISLYGERGMTLPSWFKNNDWDARFMIKTGTLFRREDAFFNQVRVSGIFPVSVSCAEMAVMEYLAPVRDHASFMSARELMEGMADLRAEIVQKLLENCNSVKVKRIFLYLADCLEHPWVSRIDMTKISLGQGKRAVVKGGVFNKKYKLSVPREIKEECAF